MSKVVSIPSYPQDFKVIYAEGASFWWWSPSTGPDFDGTVPMGEDYPVGLMIGNEDTTSHEFVTGDEVIIVWDVDEAVNRIERKFVYRGDDTRINELVEEVVASLAVHS